MRHQFPEFAGTRTPGTYASAYSKAGGPGGANRTGAVAGMTALALLTVGTAAPGTSQEQARSTLKVTPGMYVAGQKMT